MTTVKPEYSLHNYYHPLLECPTCYISGRLW